MVFANSKVAVSSWAWHDAFYKGDFSLIDVPAKANALGIYHVELNDFMLPPGRLSRTRAFFATLINKSPSHPSLKRYVPSTMRKLKNELKKNKVQCNSWTVDSDLTGSESMWRNELQYILKAWQAAADLDATYLRITLGGTEHIGDHIDDLVARRLNMLAALGNMFYPSVKLLVENHWGISTNISRFLNIVNQADDVGVCFDPGNVPFAKRRDDWSRLASRAEMFHLKVFNLDHSKIDQEIEYDFLFNLLAHEYFAGPCVIEYEGNGNPDESVREIFAQMMSWQRSTNTQKVEPKKVKPKNKKASISSFYKPVSAGVISLQDSQAQ
ncbi:MAG: TIM barrel protein [Chloroflexota bacterium]